MYVVKAKNAADSGWTTIYDSSDKALCLISQPKNSSEMNQPGSFDFTIYPDSIFYDAIAPMNTFVSAFEGTDAEHLDETFYGRVLTCEDDFYGTKNVSCEGAFSFLKDATVGQVSTDENNSGREYLTSPQAFLQEQLAAYNAKVEDRKKLFYGGTSGITTSSTELFKIDDDQDFRSILESQLIDVYGGFFKIARLPNGTHELWYVKNYGINVGTAQTIQIGQNILDKQKHVTGEGAFTFIRPVGKDGVRLDDGVYHGVVCNSSNGRSGLYPVGTDEASFNALYARYGFIEKTKSFDDCENSDALANSCNSYVRDHGLDAIDKLPMTFDVKLVDFFNANPNVKRIELGANYILTVDSDGRETGFEGHADGTPLQEGQEGLTLTVYTINREYENPENDSIVLYNATFLTAKDYSVILSSMTGSYSGGGSSRGGLSGLMAKSEKSDAEEEKEFKRFETFYEKTDEKFSWLATDSEWDELSQTSHVTAFTQLTRTAHFVEDTAKKELPFEDWKAQWLIAHPEDASLPETELRAKYNEWIAANPYAIYNTQYSDATRTERIISKTGINDLGQNETITSRVTQTADRLQSEISSTKSGVYSAVEQTLSGFRQVVSDDIAGYKSEIEQSNNSFKAEIHNTISDIYTRILAWDGGAAIDIRQGNRVFKQFNAPSYALPDDDTLQAGDIWVKSNDMRTWGETSDKPWGDVNSFHWDDYVGDEIYVWKDGRWQRVMSEKELVVQAHRFQTTMDETWDVIDDTANGLRVEMSRTVSRFYQTFTDSVNGLSSTITQTASQIRSEVSDTKNGLQSSITQTASQIRSEVSNTANSLRSSITQQENRIDLVVEGTGSNAKIKPAAIIAAINEQTGQSQVLIEANQIAVAATDLASWGVYTDGTLTGGVIAEKLNSGTNTYVSGDRVFIGDISFDFQRVYPSSSTNPAAMDYFEEISNNYILTKDITPVPGKAYYQRTIGVNAENANDKFTAVDRLIAGKVDTQTLVANYATINELHSNYTDTATLEAGFATIRELNVTDGKIENLAAGNTQATKLWVVDVLANNVSVGSSVSGDMYYRGKPLTSAWLLNHDGTKKYPVLTINGLEDSQSSGYSALGNAIASISKNNNAPSGQIGLSYTTLDGTSRTVNFNIAATQFYQDALAAGRIISANDNVVSGTLTVSSGSPVTLYPGHVIGGVVSKITDYALTITSSGVNFDDIDVIYCYKNNSGDTWSSLRTTQRLEATNDILVQVGKAGVGWSSSFEVRVGVEGDSGGTPSGEEGGEEPVTPVVPNASAINLYPNGTPDDIFFISYQEEGSGSTHAQILQQATSLGTLSSLMRANHGQYGNVVFKATIDGGTGEKWYKVATA